MKIGHNADKTAPAPAKTGTSAASSSQTPAANANAIPVTADPSATIELSSTASTLLSGNVTPEFDAEKVDRISKSIEDGTFKANPEAIADKLISNAQELLTKFQS